MLNKCKNDLAVRKLFSFPHAQILLAFFPGNFLRAYFGKNMPGERSSLDSGLQVRVCESPAKLRSLRAAVSSAQSLTV
jgi:hypothetical protein